MAESPTGKYYPNKLGRIYLLAIEDVMGKNGMNAILNLAKLKHLINNYPPNNLNREFSFEEFSALNQAVEDMYGPRGGRGLNLRAGRATFKYGLKEFGAVLGLSDLAFKLLPLSMKLKVGLPAFADVFNKFSDQVVRLEEKEDEWHWFIDVCPVCWGRKSDGPNCYTAIGLLQESLHWVSGGKNFRVVQTTGKSAGDETCTFVISKEPLD